VKKHPLLWYSLATLLLLTPFGLRVLTWPTPRTPIVEPTLADAGRILFIHEWTPHDPLCASGDGLGPVYNATSCAACHRQGGLGGSGGLEHNVTTFLQQFPGRNGTTREGVVHAEGIKYQETLRDLDQRLPAISRPPLKMLLPPQGRRGEEVALLNLPPGLHLSQRNTPALFGARFIDAIPEHVIIAAERRQRLQSAGASPQSETEPVGRVLWLPNGRVGRFGWKAQSASLSDFVRAACAGELGLSNPGQDQPRPLNKPDYQAVGLDLTARQCDEMTAFVALLPRPLERVPSDASPRHTTEEGKRIFEQVGCAVCHTAQLGSVAGLYSDLLLHRMGQDLEGSGGYNQPPPSLPGSSPGEGALPDEWRTPPLWGVADSAPYLHDGRAATLEEAILLHAGQAAPAALRFRRLRPQERDQLLAFLSSLRAPG
jgi:CxxC motif-containing protein (DUF1111 family)